MSRHKGRKKNSGRQKMPEKEKKKLPGHDAENSIFGKMLADIRAWAAEKMESLQSMDMKRLILMNLPYAAAVYIFDKSAWLYRH